MGEKVQGIHIPSSFPYGDLPKCGGGGGELRVETEEAVTQTRVIRNLIVGFCFKFKFFVAVLDTVFILGLSFKISPILFTIMLHGGMEIG